MSQLLEILSPVGDMERLHAALDYGADAVYLGGTAFGMRAASAKFTPELLAEACSLAHSKGKRVYLTCNTLPRNSEIPAFEGFVKDAAAAGVDALIITDLGLLALAKKFVPDMEIHISTQAGIVNYATANEFYSMGAKRVVLARELTLEEVAEIRAKTPTELDIECFVHGAMCVSFSGRCLLSQYLTNRDANRGECAQPCRWGYHLMEEKRPDEFYPIFEDEQGTFILNAKDMCLIEHLDKLAKAGVNSFKIEGRAKSSYYVSVITNAYRKAMDIYKAAPENYQLPQWLKDEVFKVSHRAYCTGFFFGHPKESQYYENSGYVREYDVVAIIDHCENGRIYAQQRNKFNLGDEVEVLSPEGEPVTFTVNEMFNDKGESIETANHAAMDLSITSDLVFPRNSIIRIKK
ncbi:U32 family peptidase [Ruminococcus sp.]|uniref:peptidase U32 family protein n=1 Tax=Ruminococcus sp. TaxID=41978 RepID=UPI0025F15FE8|nr:U32 family peptidase [Ruminococcus sp.]MBQ8965225.1 U32 family peptidase [Ruminococcus sp.]